MKTRIPREPEQWKQIVIQCLPFLASLLLGISGFLLDSILGELMFAADARRFATTAVSGDQAEIQDILDHRASSSNDLSQIASVIVERIQGTVKESVHGSGAVSAVLMAGIGAMLGAFLGMLLKVKLSEDFADFFLPPQFVRVLNEFIASHKGLGPDALHGITDPLTSVIMASDLSSHGRSGLMMWCTNVNVDAYAELATELARQCRRCIQSTTYYDSIQLFRDLGHIPSIKAWLDECRQAKKQNSVSVSRVHVFENDHEYQLLCDCYNDGAALSEKLAAYCKERGINGDAQTTYSPANIEAGKKVYIDHYVADYLDSFHLHILHEGDNPLYCGEIIAFDGALALVYDEKFRHLKIMWGMIPAKITSTFPSRDKSAWQCYKRALDMACTPSELKEKIKAINSKRPAEDVSDGSGSA